MSRPPEPETMRRRLMPRLHHAAGFVVLSCLLVIAVSNPFRVQGRAATGSDLCNVELSYPARMMFAESEVLEARIMTSERCVDPNLVVDAHYLRRFRAVNQMTSEGGPTGMSRAFGDQTRSLRVRMELSATRSLHATGQVEARCGTEVCARLPVSTFVFP